MNLNDSSLLISDDDNEFLQMPQSAYSSLPEHEEEENDQPLPPSPPAPVTRSQTGRGYFYQLGNGSDDSKPVPKTRKTHEKMKDSLNSHASGPRRPPDQENIHNTWKNGTTTVIASASCPRYENGHVASYKETIKQITAKYVQLFISHCSCFSASVSNKYAVLLSLVFLNTLILAYFIAVIHQMQAQIILGQGQVQTLSMMLVTSEALNDKLLQQEWRLTNTLESKIMTQSDLILTELDDLHRSVDSIVLRSRSEDVQTQTDKQAPESRSLRQPESPEPEPKDGFFSFFSKFSLEPSTMEENSRGDNDKVTQLRKALESLQSTQFPAQPRQTWVEVLAAVASTLEMKQQRDNQQASGRPGVIFVLQPPHDSSQFGLCFARRLAETVSRVLSNGASTVVKEVSPEYFLSFATVTELQADLEAHLASEGKTILVRDAHLVQRKELLYLFHSFCDNLVAPDPKAIFIFVSTIPRELEAAVSDYVWHHDNGNKIANAFLNAAWRSALSEDKRAALIARVAPSVVLLQPHSTLEMPNCD